MNEFTYLFRPDKLKLKIYVRVSKVHNKIEEKDEFKRIFQN